MGRSAIISIVIVLVACKAPPGDPVKAEPPPGDKPEGARENDLEVAGFLLSRGASRLKDTWDNYPRDLAFDEVAELLKAE